MDKALALRVWRFLEDGHTLYAIEEQEGVPRRTGLRLKTAAEGFESQTDIHDISKHALVFIYKFSDTPLPTGRGI